MGKKIVKYNPAFLSDKELIETFVVRHTDLELVLQPIRENTTQSNQHMMIIGPRGIGKTTLALRAVAEVRKDEKLNDKWYPLVFAEESYQVTSAGEFWLEALFHLGQQEKRSKWHETYKELQDESNEDRLADRALAQLLDFADLQKKRLLLVVENFNMLLGDQIGDDDAWKMRNTLQHEKRIMLLATATTRFEQMDNPGKAMFELFRPLTLKPLDSSECREIWKSVTGKDLSEERTRPLQILTGGNPRLMTIISSFGKDMSFNKLMNELTRLVDDHTEYFKSHLDGLPPIERKAYLALAELWDPSLAKEVAKLARLDVSKTSSLLGRLKDKGAVVVTQEKGRKKWYQVAERMYNIYYLMRRRGAASRRIKAVVRFMVHFYDKHDLIRAANRIAEEACDLETMHRENHYLAYQEICSNVNKGAFRELLNETPENFFNMPDIPEHIKALGKSREVIKFEEEVFKTLSKANKLIKESGDLECAKQILHDVIKDVAKVNVSNCEIWCNIGCLSDELQLYEEAENAFSKVIELSPKCVAAWGQLGKILHKKLDRHKEAETFFRKAIELDSNKKARGWLSLGSVLESLERFAEAEEVYRKAVEIEPQKINAWLSLGHLLHCKLGKTEEAEKAYRTAIKIEKENSHVWLDYGYFNYSIGKYKEAEKAYKRAVELQSDIWRGWEVLGRLLHCHLHKYEEAARAYRKATEQNPEIYNSWVYLAELMLDKLNQPLEALSLAGKYLSVNIKDSASLNEFAWAFFKYGKSEHLGQAESWIRKAIEINSDNRSYQHTLASILCARNNISESLESAKEYLDDCQLVKKTVEDAIDLFVNLAANGHAQQALEILSNSPSADILEPLIVGLRLFIGQDVSAAAEILEVGKDVAKKIEECKAEKNK